VLDNTAGSGTTAIAAENAGRRWICVERDEDYAAKGIERIERHVHCDSNVIRFPAQSARLSFGTRDALLWFAVAA
jgi:hypothetical protein